MYFNFFEMNKLSKLLIVIGAILILAAQLSKIQHWDTPPQIMTVGIGTLLVGLVIYAIGMLRK